MKINYADKILKKAPFAFAYHEIILDEKGKPYDYRFLEINNTFEEFRIKK